MKNEGNWVAACGGLEKPMLVNGTRWLYVWNGTTGQHGWLNLDTDIVYTDRDFVFPG